VTYLKYLIKWCLLGLDGISSVSFNPKKKGVVIVRLDSIGDFIIWLDTAKEYRRIYPNQKITLIANAAWADMASCLTYWDEVWPVSLDSLKWSSICRWVILHKVSRANFETAIHPTFSRSFMYGDSVIRATRANFRIGSIGDTSNIKANDKAISDRWYNQLIKASPNSLMELFRNAEFIKNLTGKDFTCSLPKWPAIGVRPKKILQLNNDYAILFPSASWHGRQWPKQYFVELGERLHHLYGWQIFLCGAPSDYLLCQEIAESASINFFNLAGQTTLVEFAEILRGAKLLISNETSAAHLAVSVGSPSVIILGGGHHGRFLPYPEYLLGVKTKVATNRMPCFNCNWQCTESYDTMGPVPCISGVSVAQVLALVPQALDA
jgi:ADP-heptose:LPS heptosyltransferase